MRAPGCAGGGVVRRWHAASAGRGARHRCACAPGRAAGISRAGCSGRTSTARMAGPPRTAQAAGAALGWTHGVGMGTGGCRVGRAACGACCCGAGAASWGSSSAAGGRSSAPRCAARALGDSTRHCSAGRAGYQRRCAGGAGACGARIHGWRACGHGGASCSQWLGAHACVAPAGGAGWRSTSAGVRCRPRPAVAGAMRFGCSAGHQR